MATIMEIVINIIEKNSTRLLAPQIIVVFMCLFVVTIKCNEMTFSNFTLFNSELTFGAL